MERLPASDAQVRLWSAANLDPEPCTYHIPVAIRLGRAVSLDAIESALNQLLEAHEILRTGFELQGRALMQVIHPRVDLELECQHCQSSELDMTMQAIAMQAMDLHRAPLFRVVLLHSEPLEGGVAQKPVLLWVMHHLITDGASMNALLQDFLAALQGRLVVDPEALSYADLSEWAREHWDSEAGRSEVQALSSYLEQSPCQVLGETRRGESVQEDAGGLEALRLEQSLGPECGASLLALQQRGFTPLMVFAAALFAFLGRRGSGRDLCIGSTLAARGRAELAEVVGPVANTVVIRQRLEPSWTREVLLKATQRELLVAHQRAMVPIEKVLARRSGPRNSDGHPLFDLMFLVQPAGPAPSEDYEVLPVSLPRKRAKFPLTLSWRPTQGPADTEWILQLEADPRFFDQASLSAFAQGCIREVQAMLQAPDEALVIGAHSVVEAPRAKQDASHQGLEGSWSVMERVLGKLLSQETLRPEQDFFAVGGDSIVAMQLVQALRDEGLSLSTQDIFETAELGKIARRIQTLESLPASTSQVKDAAWDGRPSPLAAGMVLHTQKARSSRVFAKDLYIQQFSVQLSGPFDQGRWQEAFDCVIRRHSSLRSDFRVDPERGLIQSFASPSGLSMPVFMHPAPQGELGFSPDILATFRTELAASESVPWMRLDVQSDGQRSVFAWSYHHALLDGWSAGLVLSEILQAYAQPASAQEPFEDVYPDYLAWVHRQAFDEGFWRAQLQGAQTRLAPALPSASEESEPCSRTRRIALKPAVAQTLRQVCQREKLTLSSCLLAAWALARGRYSRARAWVWGSTVSGRDIDRPGVSSMVGVLMNTLPLRVELCPDKPLSQWIAELFAGQQALSARSSTPLTKISGALKQRELFDELWVFENYPVAATQEGMDLEIQTLGFHDAAHYPLCAVASDHQQMSLRVSFDARRYNEPMVEQWLAEFAQNLTRWAEQKDWSQPLGALWGESPVQAQAAEESSALVDERPLLMEMARQRGEAAAVCVGARTWSYSEIFGAAQRLALRQKVSVGDRVVLRLDPGAAYVVGALACRLSGATYVPIDPQLPSARVSTLTKRANATQVWGRLSDDDALDLEGLLPSLVSSSEQDPYPDLPLGAPLHPHCLAYAIYTSGSSGTPKLVGVSQQGLFHLCEWHRSQYGAQPGQRVASMAGVGFDASVWDLWPALRAGATLYVVDPALRKDSAGLRRWFEEERIEDAFVPTAMVQRWAQEGWPQSPSLKRIRTGGEALRTLPSLPQAELVNHYGPTEASVVATVHCVDEKALQAPASIGRASGATKVQLVDAATRALQGQGVGEICIGGPGADNLYVDNPRATAWAWRPDPSGVGARRYHSGDLAQADPSGQLRYRGRIDRQVQVSGMRIEPGEIEAVLLRHPKLREVCVLVDEAQQPARLYAVLVPHQNWDASAQQELKAQVQATLPASMHPCAYRQLEALPLSPSGKVDQKALLDYPWQAQSAAVPPQSEEARTLLTLWKELLPQVPHDQNANFFALGGDSIVAVQMLARACAQGLQLRAGDVEQAPTVAELVELHRGRGAERAQGRTLESPRGDATQAKALQTRLRSELSWGEDLWEVYPAPPLAAGMLFVAKAQRDAPERYLESIVLRVEESMHAGALRASFAQLVEETLTLCTGYRFDPEGGALLLLAHPKTVAARAPEAIVVCESGAAARERALNEAREALLDWEQPLLLRAVAQSEQEESWTLTVLFSHVILDGWSTGRLLARWLELYRHAQRGEQAPLRIQGDPRKYWQWASEQDEDALLAYWKPELSGIPGPSRLRDQAVCKAGAGQASLQWDLPDALAQSLQESAKARNLTPNTLCEAAFALTLSGYLGQGDLCFASTVSVRPPELAKVEQMVGLLINTVVSRVKLDPHQAVDQYLAALAKQSAQRRAHAGLPLSTALRLAGQVSSHGESEGLLDSLFVYENYPRWDASAVNEDEVGSVRLLESEHRTHYALSLTVLAHQSFALRFGYDASSLDADWVREFYQRYLSALEQVCQQGDVALGALDWPGETRQRVVEENPSTVQALPILPAFWRQLRERPQSIAAIDERGSYSYQHLGSMVQGIRKTLLAAGVAPGDVVVIATGPSVHSVAALWAIWYCQAAFWVVDPQTPDSRLRAMFDKVQPRAWLGEAPDVVKELGISVLSEEVQDPDQYEAIALPEPSPLHPSSLAYVMYTSGSTGVPKAVMVGHDSLRRHQDWVRESRGLGPDDVVLHKTPLSFDGALWEVLAPLSLGARCVIAPQSTRLDPRALWSWIVDQQVSVMQFVPSWIKELVVQARSDERCWPASLRLIALGGERVEPELLQALRDRAAPGATLCLHNVYGPTECTVDVTAKVLEHEDELPAVVPIGTDVTGARNEVLDHQGRPCASRCVGELYIGGSALAFGYAKDPRQTALRFVPDPRATHPGARLYRSLDLVYRDAHGELVFVGRSDDQVKVGGHRIDLLEVEAPMRALAERFGIAQIAAVVHRLGDRDQLWAAYTEEPGMQAQIPELRAALAQALLPSHCPRRFVALSSWPQSQSGKTDRKALARWVAQQEDQNPSELSVETSSLEARLIDVWRQVFGGQSVDRESDFFALGGDSISSMQVVGRLREAGVECEPRDLFEHPRLGELASVLEQAARNEVSGGNLHPQLGQAEPLARAPIQAAFEQRGLVAPEHFNQSVLVTLHREVDPTQLAGWLDQLAKRHPELRVAASEEHDAWPVACLDLRDCPPSEVEARKLEAFTRAHQSLSRSQGPMARAVYVRLGESGQGVAQLMLVIHHWAVDAVSWRTLLGELSRLASQVNIPETVDRGMDRWKEQLGIYCQSEAASRECEHWCSLARGQRPLTLCASDLSFGVQDAQEKMVTLDATSTQALLTFAATQPRVPLTALLMTALGQSLWSVFVQDRPCDSLWIAVEGHGRESHRLAQQLPGLGPVDLSASVGWFTSIYPCAGDAQLWSAPLHRDSIMLVHEQLTAAPLAGAGFGVIKFFGSPKHRAALTNLPEPQVSWNYLGQMDAQGQDPLVKAVEKDPAPSQDPRNTRAYPLDASAYIQKGQLHLVWSYCAKHLDLTRVQQAFEDWVQRIEGLAHQDPESESPGPQDALPDLDELAELLDLEAMPGDAGVDDMEPQ